MLEISDEILKQVSSIKKDYLKARGKIKEDFFSDQKGIKCCKSNSEITDLFIKKVFSLIRKIKKIDNKIFICAVGGYGRKQLAPYSDIDLVFAYNKNLKKPELKVIIEFILYPLWDLGLKVGYAVRTYEEIILYSKRDQVIKTTILDARIIAGSKKNFEKIITNYTNEFSKNAINFLKQKIRERKKNIKKIGFDYFQNEPNLKESQGSLRDINIIYWSLKILNISKKKGFNKIENFLNKDEKKKITKALDFLLTLRCFTHYISQRQNDKLTFDLQKIIAEKRIHNKNTDINFLVELLMKDYFAQIKLVKTYSQILLESIENIINKDLILRSKKITANFKSNIFKNIFENNFLPSDFRLVLNNLSKIKKNQLLEKKNLEYFKKIFLSRSLNKFLILNETGLLGKLIPEFSRIDNLPQFDRFHALSVGQHTLKVLNVLKIINSSHGKDDYEFAYTVFNKKPNKTSLFYAALLHDIGKGLGGEHSVKGALRAKNIVLKLGENSEIAEEVFWLIQNHLLLSEFAFKRDIEDDSVVNKVCQKIDNINRLNSLYLLTVADISAVDHGIWNEWKAKLLETLYLKIQKEILKPRIGQSLNNKIKKIKEKVFLNSKKIRKAQMEEFSKNTYPNYWLLQNEKSIRFQIENFFLGKKKETRFDFFIKKIDKNNFLEIVIVTNDRPSLFLNLITIFFSERFSVHEARIFTFDDGTVIDTFIVSIDVNYKIENIEFKSKIKTLKEKFTSLGNNKITKIVNKNFSLKKRFIEKIDISIDNNSSSTYTVLEVITNNRPGLLYDISKVLLNEKLVISMAKISTNGDFVEDSFHLRNEFGMKVDNKDEMIHLKKKIYHTLKEGLKNVS